MSDFFRSCYYNFITGVGNLITWFPVVWEDRQYDHSFLLYILQKKLRLMERHYRSDKPMIADAKKVADQIGGQLQILNGILEDEYHDKVFKEHDEKWGELEMTFCEPDSGKCGRLLFIRKNAVTDEDKIQEHNETKELWSLEKQQETQDYYKFFLGLARYMRNWWD